MSNKNNEEFPALKAIGYNAEKILIDLEQNLESENQDLLPILQLDTIIDYLSNAKSININTLAQLAFELSDLTSRVKVIIENRSQEEQDEIVKYLDDANNRAVKMISDRPREDIKDFMVESMIANQHEPIGSKAQKLTFLGLGFGERSFYQLYTEAQTESREASIQDSESSGVTEKEFEDFTLDYTSTDIDSRKPEPEKKKISDEDINIKESALRFTGILDSNNFNFESLLKSLNLPRIQENLLSEIIDQIDPIARYLEGINKSIDSKIKGLTEQDKIANKAKIEVLTNLYNYIGNLKAITDIKKTEMSDPKALADLIDDIEQTIQSLSQLNHKGNAFLVGELTKIYQKLSPLFKQKSDSINVTEESLDLEELFDKAQIVINNASLNKVMQLTLDQLKQHVGEGQHIYRELKKAVDINENKKLIRDQVISKLEIANQKIIARLIDQLSPYTISISLTEIIRQGSFEAGSIDFILEKYGIKEIQLVLLSDSIIKSNDLNSLLPKLEELRKTIILFKEQNIGNNLLLSELSLRENKINGLIQACVQKILNQEVKDMREIPVDQRYRNAERLLKLLEYSIEYNISDRTFQDFTRILGLNQLATKFTSDELSDFQAFLTTYKDKLPGYIDKTIIESKFFNLLSDEQQSKLLDNLRRIQDLVEELYNATIPLHQRATEKDLDTVEKQIEREQKRKSEMEKRVSQAIHAKRESVLDRSSETSRPQSFIQKEKTILTLPGFSDEFTLIPTSATQTAKDISELNILRRKLPYQLSKSDLKSRDRIIKRLHRENVFGLSNIVKKAIQNYNQAQTEEERTQKLQELIDLKRYLDIIGKWNKETDPDKIQTEDKNVRKFILNIFNVFKNRLSESQQETLQSLINFEMLKLDGHIQRAKSVEVINSKESTTETHEPKIDFIEAAQAGTTVEREVPFSLLEIRVTQAYSQFIKPEVQQILKAHPDYNPDNETPYNQSITRKIAKMIGLRERNIELKRRIYIAQFMGINLADDKNGNKSTLKKKVESYIEHLKNARDDLIYSTDKDSKLIAIFDAEIRYAEALVKACDKSVTRDLKSRRLDALLTTSLKRVRAEKIQLVIEKQHAENRTLYETPSQPIVYHSHADRRMAVKIKMDELYSQHPKLYRKFRSAFAYNFESRTESGRKKLSKNQIALGEQLEEITKEVIHVLKFTHLNIQDNELAEALKEYADPKIKGRDLERQLVMQIQRTAENNWINLSETPAVDTMREEAYNPIDNLKKLVENNYHLNKSKIQRYINEYKQLPPEFERTPTQQKKAEKIQKNLANLLGLREYNELLRHEIVLNIALSDKHGRLSQLDEKARQYAVAIREVNTLIQADNEKLTQSYFQDHIQIPSIDLSNILLNESALASSLSAKSTKGLKAVKNETTGEFQAQKARDISTGRAITASLELKKRKFQEWIGNPPKTPPKKPRLEEPGIKKKPH